MDTSSKTIPALVGPVSDFDIEVADDPVTSYNVLRHSGLKVADLDSTVIEAQFRLEDGSTVVLASDNTQFNEKLTILLVGPDLRVRDTWTQAGVYTPGFLTYASMRTPTEIAFCWHDRDQVLTVTPRREWFGLRTRWLKVRDLLPQRDPDTRAHKPTR